MANTKNTIAKKLAAAGMSVAASLSAAYLIIPQEGSVKNRQGEHVAYIDAVGIPTACYGQTGKDLYGKIIRKGMVYSEDECLTMLNASVRHFEKAVELYTKVDFASTFQKASFISFAYNVGAGAYQSSTLLKKLNAGNHEGACEELMKWKYGGGKVLPGLEKRRKEEKAWCTGDVQYEAVITFSEISHIVKTDFEFVHPKQE